MAEDFRGRAAEALIALIPLYYKNVMRNRHTANGVLIAEYHTLGLLMKYKALPMSEIGDRLYISRPYMTRLADIMIADGLVERQADPKDRRVTNLAITAKGKKFLKESVSKYKKDLMESFGGLTDAELEHLGKALEEAYQILIKVDRR
ncbi:MarR family winged helix-turn-helix transcriptional regulator [Methanoregula sp. UBA64]|jgi:DNA-binding MarR family transcriptional regulator|uniref:MarR family winged helix-turn-helix transcriptional regulator n=1 Tax=Methanoregula sp. UBA64 TaxID=1915554 RepID=UPI0025F537B2|nr:MarR family transcriptional regulator [Methanoregula sp. UBA64]